MERHDSTSSRGWRGNCSEKAQLAGSVIIASRFRATLVGNHDLRGGKPQRGSAATAAQSQQRSAASRGRGHRRRESAPRQRPAAAACPSAPPARRRRLPASSRSISNLQSCSEEAAAMVHPPGHTPWMSASELKTCGWEFDMAATAKISPPARMPWKCLESV